MVDKRRFQALIDAAERHGLTYVGVEVGDEEYAIERKHARRPEPRPMAAAAVPAPAAPKEAFIKSTLVGYYRETGALEIGKDVEKGTSVAVIEALGLANDLSARIGGKVAETYVSDGEPVEYGQPIARVE